MLSRHWIWAAPVAVVFFVAIFSSHHYWVLKKTERVTKTQDKIGLARFNKQQTYEKYKTKLCELDKSRLINVEKFNFSKHTNDQIEDALHAIIMDPTDTVCQEKHRFGGGYRSDCHYVDGGKYVCMDDLIYDIMNNECAIFSFGIADDWTFEDLMDSLGCTVFAFDPSVNFPSKRGQSITFEKLGVAAKRDKAKLMDTLGNILKQYHYENKKISYLKMDIEDSELTGLPQWLSDGALKNVQQIAIEVHLRGTQTTIEFLKTIQRLYLEGDYRLISYEPNGCWHNIAKTEKFFYLSEIVLKKVSHEYQVAEKNCKILGA